MSWGYTKTPDGQTYRNMYLLRCVERTIKTGSVSGYVVWGWGVGFSCRVGALAPTKTATSSIFVKDLRVIEPAKRMGKNHVCHRLPDSGDFQCKSRIPWVSLG